MGNGHSLFDFGPMAGEYDRWYDTPEARCHDRHQKALVRHFLPLARPGERLLDVGCGTGHWSRFFASLGYDVVGVDISRRMIEVAKANASPPCAFAVADACKLPFNTGSFEIVAAMAALEFVSDTTGTLRQMCRCARPSGRVLMGTLNRTAAINQHRLAASKEPYASARMFSPKELRTFLGQYGRVRTRVSREALKEHRCRHAGSFWRRAVSRPGRPRGAFIVAEVRRWTLTPN
jgi:ubiquinone/menaquinone biosynthesis C-methylase UbiE